jgi:hypothetical protein
MRKLRKDHILADKVIAGPGFNSRRVVKRRNAKLRRNKSKILIAMGMDG